MLTIHLTHPTYAKPLSIQTNSNALLRDFITEVNRVCQENFLNIPSTYAFAGKVWSKADLNKPLEELINKTQGEININVKMKIKAEDVQYDLHPDSLNLPTTHHHDQPPLMPATTKYILTDNLTPNFDLTSRKWSKKINHFITESKSLIKATIKNTNDDRVLTISGRGSFEDLCEWVVKIKERYSQLDLREVSRQTGSDAINHIHYHIALSPLAAAPGRPPILGMVAEINPEEIIEHVLPFPLPTQIIHGVLFNYMSIEEVRGFCSALEMDEEETRNYIKKYHKGLLDQIGKAEFKPPALDQDERLFNLHAHLREACEDPYKVLIKAAKQGDYWLAELALRQSNLDLRGDGDENIYNIFSFAIVYNHMQVLQLLLAQPDIEVNDKELFYETALILAARKGNIKAVQLLLQHPKIAVNAANFHREETPLIIASEEGHSDIVRLLLEHPRIDINQVNKKGFSALMVAVCRGHTQIVNLLIERPEINVNITNQDMMTAFKLAILNCRLEVIKRLLTVPSIISFFVNHCLDPFREVTDLLLPINLKIKHEIISLIQTYLDKSLIKEKALIISQGIMTLDTPLKKCHFNKLNADLGGKIAAFATATKESKGEELEQTAAQYIEGFISTPRTTNIQSISTDGTETVCDEKAVYHIISNAAKSSGLTMSISSENDTTIIVQGRKSRAEFRKWLTKLSLGNPTLNLTFMSMTTSSDHVNSMVIHAPKLKFEKSEKEGASQSNLIVARTNNKTPETQVPQVTTLGFLGQRSLSKFPDFKVNTNQIPNFPLAQKNIILKILSDKSYWQTKHITGMQLPSGIKKIQNHLENKDWAVISKIAFEQLLPTNSSKFFKRNNITEKMYQYLSQSSFHETSKLFAIIQEDYERFSQKKVMQRNCSGWRK